MKWFLNVRTRTKLILGFGFMIFLLAVALAAACLAILETQKTQKVLCEEQVTIVRDFMHVKNGVDGMRAVLPLMVMAADRAEVERWREVAQDSDAYVHAAIVRLEKATRNRPNLRGRFDELRGALRVFAEDREQKTLSLLNDGKRDEAKALYLVVQIERADKIRKLADALANAAAADARQLVARTAEEAETALFAFAIVAVLAPLLGIMFVVVLCRVIAGPLAELACAAEKIGGGDLFVELPVRPGRDEIGRLNTSFRRMIVNLQTMVGAMRKTADGNLSARIKPFSDRDAVGTALAGMVGSLREMQREIDRAAKSIAAPAAEVLASAPRAASGAASVSASAGTAAAAVEDLRRAAQGVDDKAQSLAAMGRTTLSEAQQGRSAATACLVGVHRIREQAELLAANMEKLGLRNETAAEIVGVINAFCQQANILAVNAAIEAAKAGEQGRGFGAVAEELKALVEQSRQASARIKTVLNEVRQAAGAASAAMEQVNAALDAGGEQAVEAEEATGRLADAVAEAAQIEEQVAAAGRQQMIEVDRIVEVVEKLRQETGQNAAETKRIGQAAQQLGEFTEKLKGAVERFKL